MFRQAKSGFTLAELLIALAILGVIATFTIPKVLNSSTSSENTAIFKEAAGMVSGAFSSYQLDNTIATTSGPADLTAFMNYTDTTTVSADASGIVCSATILCLKLHNGAVLGYTVAGVFSTLTNTTYITFTLDPDGAGTEGAASILLYYNGRLTSGANAVGQLGTGNSVVIGTDPAYVDW